MHRATARDLFASSYVNLHVRDAPHAVEQQVRNVGLVTFDGLDSRDAVLEVTSRYLHLSAHRDSDPDGLTVIRDTGRHTRRAGFAGLGHGELAPHTDRSSLPVPPRLMLFVCAQPAECGGVCLLTDGQAVTSTLHAHQPEALAAFSEPQAAFFGRADGVFAPVFAPLPGGRFSIRLRQDGLVRWHPFTRTYLPNLRDSAARHQQPLELHAGEGYLLDNHRWLHARTAFLGARRCYRALGNPRFRLPRGFPPHDAPAVPLETL
ncbi:TauD/TfdA family dioxygenase [Streptomyces lunalinharesii]|uniref:TauD/TfdA-like domain-containing protein n=1 Tax=Streptomyces lunalinharesii TaxID=333384 RepID=A0ABN3RPF2_9ACTN